METAKRHRYVAALLIAGTLFVIGTVVVANRAGISSVGSPNGLEINGVLQTTNSALPIPGTPPPSQPTAVNVPYTDLTAPAKTTSTQQQAPVSDNSFDWNSFITSLSHPAKQPPTAAQDTYISDAYSFIPSGLMSPPEPQSTMTMPDSEKPLYGWGQDAGGAILSYEDSHPNQPQILTDYMQDRQNASKIAAMKKLGADLQAVGDDIDNIGQVPSQVGTAAPALADAYREIGRNLATIPDAQGDDATVKAILAYDKSAEAFVQKYVAVVNILQANGVKYTQNEPGGVFMFPSGQ